MMATNTTQSAPTAEATPATQPSKDLTLATATGPSETTKDGQGSATTQPNAKGELVSAYCPMAKASWLQFGDVIANPYLGGEMPTCGTVQRRIPITAADPAFAVIIQSYLDLGKALNGDRLDAAALRSMQSATDTLRGDRYTAFRDAAVTSPSGAPIKPFDPGKPELSKGAALGQCILAAHNDVAKVKRCVQGFGR